MTAVGADGAGFPDLCMVRGHRMVYAELKVGKNKPSDRQWYWLCRLAEAGAKTYVWYPKDWPQIEDVLA